MDDKIQIILSHMLIGCVKANWPVLTRSKREVKMLYLTIISRCCLRFPNWTDFRTGLKLVIIPCGRIQSTDFNVDRVTKLWFGKFRSSFYDILKMGIKRNFPLDREWMVVHATSV